MRKFKKVNFKKLAGVSIVLAGALLLTAACSMSSNPSSGNSGAISAARGLSEASQVNQYGQGQPIPQFSYSQYRETMVEVEAAQALGEGGTAFFFNQGVQNPIFQCPMKGQPIPNTAQLSNPVQAQWNNDTYNGDGIAGVTIGQIDPNGTYAPSNSTGTYVMCVTTNGQPELHYWEGFVYAVAGPAKWVSGQGIVETGAPKMPSCSLQTTQVKGQTVNKTVCAK